LPSSSVVALAVAQWRGSRGGSTSAPAVSPWGERERASCNYLVWVFVVGFSFGQATASQCRWAKRSTQIDLSTGWPFTGGEGLAGDASFRWAPGEPRTVAASTVFLARFGGLRHCSRVCLTHQFLVLGRALERNAWPLATMIKSLQPKVSNRGIAKALGVGSRTIDRDIAPNDAPRGKTASRINGGGAPNDAMSGDQAAKLVQRREGLVNSQHLRRLPPRHER
jgi:hypothetical protein